MMIPGTTPGEQVLPFYLVCDESASMSGDPIDAMNETLPELHHAIGANPVVADKTRFCIIGFSDAAQVLLPLSNLSEVTQLPVLETTGGTNYSAAFTMLKSQIESDVVHLKSQGNRVFRPVVFFLTDGEPNSDWADEYAELMDDNNRYRPNILAFGIGNANVQTISAVASFKAFISDGSMSPASALQEFASALTRSIVRSGTSATSAGMPLLAPNQVAGFTTLDSDEL